MNECGTIAPKQEEVVGYRNDGYLAECILPSGHCCSEHVVKIPEGNYFVWGYDYTCDCCELEEYQHCFYHVEISEQEYLKYVEQASG